MRFFFKLKIVIKGQHAVLEKMPATYLSSTLLYMGEGKN